MCQHLLDRDLSADQSSVVLCSNKIRPGRRWSCDKAQPSPSELLAFLTIKCSKYLTTEVSAQAGSSMWNPHFPVSPRYGRLLQTRNLSLSVSPHYPKSRINPPTGLLSGLLDALRLSLFPGPIDGSLRLRSLILRHPPMRGPLPLLTGIARKRRRSTVNQIAIALLVPLHEERMCWPSIRSSVPCGERAVHRIDGIL